MVTPGAEGATGVPHRGLYGLQASIGISWEVEANVQVEPWYEGQECACPADARRDPPLDQVTCFRPLKAYRKPGGGVAFDSVKGFVDLPLELPCGQCVGCRAQRAADWAVRCVNEAAMNADNSFITLTYNDEHLPEEGLVVEHLQKFFKRFRKSVAPNKVRYFACGEYGDENGRPHFHACVFGHGFRDRFAQVRVTPPLFRSALLEDLWRDPVSGKALGYASVGELQYESAAYVARYVMKKLTGKRAEEYGGVRPPFVVMSLKPGIGASWFDQHQADVFPADEIVHDGRHHRVPRYYDERFGDLCSEELEKIKIKRAMAANAHGEDQVDARLRVREKVAESRARAFRRKL